jgi:mRNA interferase HigB
MGVNGCVPDTFSGAGSGQTVCVFDIGGNRFRLIAFVSYSKAKVYVLRIMTHKEYDKGRQQWKDDL